MEIMLIFSLENAHILVQNVFAFPAEIHCVNSPEGPVCVPVFCLVVKKVVYLVIYMHSCRKFHYCYQYNGVKGSRYRPEIDHVPLSNVLIMNGVIFFFFFLPFTNGFVKS